MSVGDAAPIFDAEVDFVARALIVQHGDGAARAAVDHLNRMIDLGNFRRRDMWARVVHAIHDHERLCRAAELGVTTSRELSQLAAMGAGGPSDFCPCGQIERGAAA